MPTNSGTLLIRLVPKCLWTVAVLWLLLPLVSLSAETTDSDSSLDDPLRLVVISDLNGSYGTIGHASIVHDAMRRIVELGPDVVISTGDMIAGQVRDPSQRNKLDALWQAFHQTVTRPLAEAGIPLGITPGNHDASAYPGFEDERALYAREWRDRKTGLDFVDAAGFPFNYAFAVKGVLLVSLDVTTTGALPAKDLDWLEALLAEHRDRFSDVIVFSHVPLWPFAEGRDREVTRDERLHAILMSGRVRLYLSGHHHAFYPGVLDGVTYISQACLGSGARKLLGSEAGRAPKGFTHITLDGDRVLVSAVSAPAFQSTQDWATLPPQIVSDGVRLQRADLVDVPVFPSDLPQPAEAR